MSPRFCLLAYPFAYPFTVEYKNVAIEQVYDDTITTSKAKKGDPIPEPLKLDLSEFDGKLRVFSRLSILFADNAISLVTVSTLTDLTCIKLSP